MSRESRLERGAPRRSAKPRILVVCGSERTEPQYLAGLRDSLANRLLHCEDCRAPLPDYRAAVVRLRRHVPAYDKAELTFADYAETVTQAIQRAKAIDATGTDHIRNPSTSVWRLAEKIMG